VHELNERELFEAMHYAKSIDEETGATIIESFQLDQPALAQTILGIFPSIISEENTEMSYLFLDLCFDVLCVFQHAFGPLPSQNNMDADWVEKQALLLNVELQSMIGDRQMDPKIRSKLQDRFVKRSLEETAQKRLVIFMNLTIDNFASQDATRSSAIMITQTMIFIVIRLFSNLYGAANKVLH
jgi:hypothetical protein